MVGGCRACWVIPRAKAVCIIFKISLANKQNKGVWGREDEEGTLATRLWRMQKTPHNHLWITASSRATYWQGYPGLTNVSLCDTFAFQNPTPYHACLSVPMPGMGLQHRGAQQWGSVRTMEQKGKPESPQYPAAVLTPSILHRHHSLSWTSCLDPSFLQGFHSWWRQDWMKTHCGLQPEHSIPSLSCHVMARPNLNLLPYKDWDSQKVCDYFPRECIKP